MAFDIQERIDMAGIGENIPHSDVDLVAFFSAVEGTLELYYGHIRNGKTYSATADMLDDLKRGRTVWSNYPVDFKGFDERKEWYIVLLSLIFPFMRRFKVVRQSNLHFYEISDEWAKKQLDPDGKRYEDFWDWFTRLTDCVVYADEGHVLLDSYRKTYVSMEQRNAVLHTGHFNRTIKIISQRPTAVHVTARGNINIFWKCEKLWSWPVLLFRKTEFQDMTMETVDETKPLHRKIYFAKRRILNAYDSKYLRKGMKPSQIPKIEVYDLSYRERIVAARKIAAAFMPRRRKIISREIRQVEPEPNWGVPPYRYPVRERADEKAIKTEVGSTLGTSADGKDQLSLPF